jgi:NAD dependent epimerase/dehydratase family enzyme
MSIMPGNSKNNSKQDLTWSSETMRDENASDRQRRIAAQNLANHRWEQEYKSRLKDSRSSSSRKISGR